MNTSKVILAAAGILLAVLIVFWIGFSAGNLSGQARGFSLPPGDSAAGKQAFVALACVNCHSVYGEPDFTRPPEYVGLVVPLGGEVRVVKTYGELVTAIIHPSESIRPDVGARYVDPSGRSIMPDYTARMTTRELVDLVTYLQGHYEVYIPKPPSNYYPYGIDVAP